MHIYCRKIVSCAPKTGDSRIEAQNQKNVGFSLDQLCLLGLISPALATVLHRDHQSTEVQYTLVGKVSLYDLYQ